LFSVIVCLYDNMAANMIGIPELQLPLTPFELTAPVLGLLLVFRTNAGYDRFTLGSDVSWEITSRLRDMSRLVAAWCDENDAKQASIAGEIMDELVLYHSWLMATYLREGGGTGSGIQEGEGGGTKREMGVEDAEAGDALRDIIRTQSQYVTVPLLPLLLLLLLLLPLPLPPLPLLLLPPRCYHYCYCHATNSLTRLSPLSGT